MNNYFFICVYVAMFAIGTSQRRVSVVKSKQRATVIAEEAEVDEEPGVSTVDHTPMVTALLGPRMLELRAAYSRQSSRRDRLEFLRHHAVVGGDEAQSHGERMYVDRQPPLRRLRLRPEPRPPGVMGIRPSNRRGDQVTVLAGVVPSGTVLLEPPLDDVEDYDFESSSMLEFSNVEEPPSRTLENWTGLSYSSTPGTASSGTSISVSEPPRSTRKK